MNKQYELQYLPTARKDIYDLTLYIANQLHAPESALRIVDAMEASIERLSEFPYAFPVYRTIKPLATEYRMLPVEGYNVFYTVLEEDKVVEIHRVLYAKRDLTKQL